MFTLPTETGYALVTGYADADSRSVIVQVVCTGLTLDLPYKGELIFYLSPDDAQNLATQLQNAVDGLQNAADHFDRAPGPIDVLAKSPD
jgi:hypothetical protein